MYYTRQHYKLSSSVLALSSCSISLSRPSLKEFRDNIEQQHIAAQQKAALQVRQKQTNPDAGSYPAGYEEGEQQIITDWSELYMNILILMIMLSYSNDDGVVNIQSGLHSVLVSFPVFDVCPIFMIFETDFEKTDAVFFIL